MTSQFQTRPVVAICTSCEYRWRTHESDLGTRIPCPDCDQPAVVRRATEEELVDVPGLVPDDGYRRGAGPSVVPVGMEDDRISVGRDKPPKWTFFSGVFTFPLYPSVFVHWIGISLFAIVIGSLTIEVFDSGAFAREIAGKAGAGRALKPTYYLLGGAVLFFLTGPYAAACFIAVLRDTASGCNKVSDWPGLDFREWFLTPRFVLMMFAAAAGIGYGIQQALDTESILPIAITVFVLFPIFMLSSLEADSALIPITLPVLRSLVVLAGPWLIVYLETFGIIALLTLLFDWALKEDQVPWAMVAAIAAAVAGGFIYARILGRLAWRASMHETSSEDEFASMAASSPPALPTGNLKD